MTRAKDISKIITDADFSGTLDVAGTVTGSSVVRAGDDTSSMQIQKSGVNGFINMNDTGGIIYRLGSSFTERMRIDSSGRVGIGTSSPSSFNSQADNLVVGTGSGANGITIYTDSTSSANIFFADGITGDDPTRGGINYNHSNNSMNFRVNDSPKMYILSSGNVGIGTSSPDTNLDVEGAGDCTISITANSTSNDSKIDFVQGSTIEGGITYDHNGSYASEKMAFRAGNNGTHMYLTGDGVLLVGQSTFNYANVGCSLTSSGQVGGTANGDVAAVFNRKTSDGEIINLRQDNSTIGGIYSSPSITGPFIGHINVGLAMYHNGDSVLPSGTGGLRDNAIDLGNGSNRFDDIFATNTTIQTSDRNEKQDIEELSEAEQRVAVVAKGLMRKYRWRDAVAEKGENARTHFGIIAQDLQDAFTAEGLDASDYAMFCSDTWWEKEISVDAVEADEENGIEAKDAYTYRKIAEEATEGYTEKTRLGVRYSELLAFIISAI